VILIFQVLHKHCSVEAPSPLERAGGEVGSFTRRGFTSTAPGYKCTAQPLDEACGNTMRGHCNKTLVGRHTISGCGFTIRHGGSTTGGCLLTMAGCGGTISGCGFTMGTGACHYISLSPCLPVGKGRPCKSNLTAGQAGLIIRSEQPAAQAATRP
jgi:hypothetical protein